MKKILIPNQISLFGFSLSLFVIAIVLSILTIFLSSCQKDELVNLPEGATGTKQVEIIRTWAGGSATFYPEWEITKVDNKTVHVSTVSTLLGNFNMIVEGETVTIPQYWLTTGNIGRFKGSGSFKNGVYNLTMTEVDLGKTYYHQITAE